MVDGRWLMDWFDEVAGAIAEQRRTDAAEGGQHEFARLAGGKRLAGCRLDDFSEISRLKHVQHAGLPRAFVSDGSSLRHAVMIEDSGAAPQLFQSRPERGNAPARFAGDDDRFHASRAQIDVFFGSDLGESQGVGRGAAEDGRAVVNHHAQTRRAAQTAARDAEAADALRGFKREPESDERPERKGEENAVARRRARRAKDLRPAFDHPVPAFRRVEPAERRAGGAAGLVKTG